jgi:hypothetical protein
MKWILCALGVAILNYLDAVLTLKAVSIFGIGIEANPLMRSLLSLSEGLFFALKFGIGIFAPLFMGYFRHLPIARSCIVLLFVVYAYILGLHFVWIKAI